MALQFKRGSTSTLATITPLAGEPLWATNTNQLYVGDGVTPGGILVGTGGGGGGGGTTSTVTDQGLFTTSSVTFSNLSVSNTASTAFLRTNEIFHNGSGGITIPTNINVDLVTVGNGSSAGRIFSRGPWNLVLGPDSNNDIGGRIVLVQGESGGVNIGNHNDGQVVQITTSSITLNRGTNITTGNLTFANNRVRIGSGATGDGSNPHIAMGFNSNAAGSYSNAIGWQAQANGPSGIAIGTGAKSDGQYSISIGWEAGSSPSNTITNAGNSIIINASTSNLNSTQSGFYVAPIRASTSTNILYYDTQTKEISFGDSGGLSGNPTFQTVNVTNTLTAASISLSNSEVISESLSGQTGTVTLDSWSTSTYRSAKYVISMTAGSDLHLVEILCGHIGGNTYKNEYGVITNNNEIATFSTDIDGGNFRLRATSTATFDVKIMKTLINL